MEAEVTTMSPEMEMLIEPAALLLGWLANILGQLMEALDARDEWTFEVRYFLPEHP